MTRTYINMETRETEELQVIKEGSMTWLGALVLEVVISIAASYTIRLIGECAGLWHENAGNWIWWSLSVSEYYRGVAKWFGFRKAFGNLVIAVFFELLAFSVFCKCLGLEPADKTDGSLEEFILAIGAAGRIVVYLLVMIFSRHSYLYNQDSWILEAEYSELASHCRTWILFWMLACAVLGLAIFFMTRWHNAAAIVCLLSIIALVAFGAYLNGGGKVSDLVTIVEGIGSTLFRHY